MATSEVLIKDYTPRKRLESIWLLKFSVIVMSSDQEKFEFPKSWSLHNPPGKQFHHGISKDDQVTCFEKVAKKDSLKPHKLRDVHHGHHEKHSKHIPDKDKGKDASKEEDRREIADQYKSQVKRNPHRHTISKDLPQQNPIVTRINHDEYNENEALVRKKNKVGQLPSKITMKKRYYNSNNLLFLVNSASSTEISEDEYFLKKFKNSHKVKNTNPAFQQLSQYKMLGSAPSKLPKQDTNKHLGTWSDGSSSKSVSPKVAIPHKVCGHHPMTRDTLRWNINQQLNCRDPLERNFFQQSCRDPLDINGYDPSPKSSAEFWKSGPMSLQEYGYVELMDTPLEPSQYTCFSPETMDLQPQVQSVQESYDILQKEMQKLGWGYLNEDVFTESINELPRNASEKIQMKQISQVFLPRGNSDPFQRANGEKDPLENLAQQLNFMNNRYTPVLVKINNQGQKPDGKSVNQPISMNLLQQSLLEIEMLKKEQQLNQSHTVLNSAAAPQNSIQNNTRQLSSGESPAENTLHYMQQTPFQNIVQELSPGVTFESDTYQENVSEIPLQHSTQQSCLPKNKSPVSLDDTLIQNVEQESKDQESSLPSSTKCTSLQTDIQQATQKESSREPVGTVPIHNSIQHIPIENDIEDVSPGKSPQTTEQDENEGKIPHLGKVNNSPGDILQGRYLLQNNQHVPNCDTYQGTLDEVSSGSSVEQMTYGVQQSLHKNIQQETTKTKHAEQQTSLSMIDDTNYIMIAIDDMSKEVVTISESTFIDESVCSVQLFDYNSPTAIQETTDKFCENVGNVDIEQESDQKKHPTLNTANLHVRTCLKLASAITDHIIKKALRQVFIQEAVDIWREKCENENSFLFTQNDLNSEEDTGSVNVEKSVLHTTNSDIMVNLSKVLFEELKNSFTDLSYITESVRKSTWDLLKSLTDFKRNDTLKNKNCSTKSAMQCLPPIQDQELKMNNNILDLKQEAEIQKLKAKEKSYLNNIVTLKQEMGKQEPKDRSNGRQWSIVGKSSKCKLNSRALSKLSALTTTTIECCDIPPCNELIPEMNIVSTFEATRELCSTPFPFTAKQNVNHRPGNLAPKKHSCCTNPKSNCPSTKSRLTAASTLSSTETRTKKKKLSPARSKSKMEISTLINHSLPVRKPSEIKSNNVIMDRRDNIKDKQTFRNNAKRKPAAEETIPSKIIKNNFPMNTTRMPVQARFDHEDSCIVCFSRSPHLAVPLSSHILNKAPIKPQVKPITKVTLPERNFEETKFCTTSFPINGILEERLLDNMFRRSGLHTKIGTSSTSPERSTVSVEESDLDEVQRKESFIVCFTRNPEIPVAVLESQPIFVDSYQDINASSNSSNLTTFQEIHHHPNFLPPMAPRLVQSLAHSCSKSNKVAPKHSCTRHCNSDGFLYNSLDQCVECLPFEHGDIKCGMTRINLFDGRTLSYERVENLDLTSSALIGDNNQNQMMDFIIVLPDYGKVHEESPTNFIPELFLEAF